MNPVNPAGPISPRADVSLEPGLAQVLVAGRWRPSQSSGTFTVESPATLDTLPGQFPISDWAELDEALSAASRAAAMLRDVGGAKLAGFLEDYAQRLEDDADALAELAHVETALPVRPRLREVELPRTIGQLRQAAQAARNGSWAMPTIDTQANIRSVLAPIGPVLVIGPNNFPMAFNAISGGDFAAAIAAGNPVIAKAHPLHPNSTRHMAELAFAAVKHAGLPESTVQLVYHMTPEDGLKLVGDPRLGATGFTGSRSAGLALKAAADRAGKPIYLEMSSLNPVVVLPGVLAERAASVADQLAGSCLMGSGQFCTNPGLVLLVDGPPTRTFISEVAQRFADAPASTLLSRGVQQHLGESIQALRHAGAEVVVAGGEPDAGRASYPNTLMRVTGSQFLASPRAFQREAFGNASLMVVCRDFEELEAVCAQLEGQLTGAIYSAGDASDDAAYDRIAAVLRRRVGRLLNDKMPTGVAVSPAMQHGGPFPATGHPHFTAVGMPAAVRRFTQLECYDAVRPHRLPPLLQDDNPLEAWRLVDGRWTDAPVGGGNQ